MFFNFKTILSVLFPNKCLSCFSYTQDQSLLCPNCLSLLSIYQYFTCIKCHKKVDLWIFAKCCHSNEFLIDSFLYCLDYKNKTVKEILHQFKYRRLLLLESTFEKILERSLKYHKDYFKHHHDYIIIPVPLNIQRYKARGFNQSDVLAKLISKIINIPYYTDVIVRHKNNPPQANIENRIQRTQNVKDIFKINQKKLNLIKNKNIILVDDVFTTGSTLNECAIILKQNQVKNIIVICLAH